MPVNKITTVSFEDEIVNELKRLKTMPEYESCTYSEIIRRLVLRGLALDKDTGKESA